MRTPHPEVPTDQPAGTGSVLAAQGRLAGLLRANRMITGDVALPVVLRQLVEAARELVGASAATLRVDASSAGPELVIRVATVGGTAAGLTDDSEDVAADSVMVPITVRGQVLGSLHLAGLDHVMSVEDEDLTSSLAATAGVAIENVRLLEESRRRQDWLQASTEVTRQLLSTEGEEPLQVIARRVQQIAAADAVNVVLPTPDGQRLMVEVATGAGAEALTALTYPTSSTVSGLVLQTGQPVLIADMDAEEQVVHLSEFVPVGPVMVLPLVGTQRVRGALVVGRLQGRPQFGAAEMEMAAAFANQAAVALELADARADQERVTLLEDRDRIARDLHDHVIQRLFGAGLTVESIASGLGADPRSIRLGQVVLDIDETIRHIRTSIFQLRGPLGPQTGAVRAALLAVAAEVAPLLGFQPQVSFTGPVDAVVPDAVIDDLEAVAREGLSNVARHGHAGRVDIRVATDTRSMVLELTDDGVGIGDTERRSGLANLRERAEHRGGSFEVISPLPDDALFAMTGGTRLRWTIPLR